PFALHGLGRQPPVADQLEVAVLLLGPQVLLLGLALAVVAQDPVLRLPVALVAWMLLPAGQVDAVVKRPEPPVRLAHVGPPGKPGAAGGQFLDAEVAEVALGALGFEAEVALARAAPAAAGDDLAVDGQPDDAVLTLDAVVVPLAGGLAAALAGQAAHPALGV